MNKIITKILLSIILCAILVAVSIGSLSVIQASKILRQEAHDKLRYISSNYANEFSTILKYVEGSVDTLGSVVATSFDADRFSTSQQYRTEFMTQLDQLLQKTGEKNRRIQGIYIAINPELTGQVFESWFINDGQGNFIYQPPEDISMFYPGSEDMAWYYEPISKPAGVWLTPYIDATINVKMISYTKAFFKDGQLIGVAGIDLAFDDIEKTIGTMGLYESGYSFLINTDLTILLHPTLPAGTYLPAIKDEDMRHVTASMANNTSDVIEYYFNHQHKSMGFSKLSNGWILGVSIVSDDILKPIELLQQRITLSVLCLLILTTIIGLLISKSITAPINRLKKMAALISQGKHDIELDLNANNEIGELSKSIHIMTRDLVASHERLKKSERKFRALAETSPLAIYMSQGIEQTGMYINPTFTRLFGYTLDDVPTLDQLWMLAYPDTAYRNRVTGKWQEKVARAIETEGEIDPMEVVVTCKDGSKKDISWGFISIGKQSWACGLDLTQRKVAERAREEIIKRLQQSLEEIKTLRGILPICANCKNIRNDEGYYVRIESYIQKHSEAVFSHGLCPECSDELYGDKDWYIEMKKKKGADLSQPPSQKR